MSEGWQYGESGGSFIRMNIACPRSWLEDGENAWWKEPGDIRNGFWPVADQPDPGIQFLNFARKKVVAWENDNCDFF